MYQRPDGGALRRDIQCDGDSARNIGSLLWEVAALDRGRMKERVCGFEEMREHIKQRGEASTGRTCIAICGTVSMFQVRACLAKFFGDRRAARGWGRGRGSLLGGGFLP